MNRFNLLAAGAILGSLLTGCTSPTPGQPAATPPVPTSTVATGTPGSLDTALDPARSGSVTDPTFVQPVRGTAEIAYVKPVTRVDNNLVVTTIRIKNRSAGTIAGLKLEEFWWDRAGNPLTGSSARLTTPLKPGEITTLRLETPKVPGMFQCNYRFSHANGAIKAVVTGTLE